MRGEISCMVRSGAMTRAQALQEIEQMCLNQTPPENVDEFCKFLGVSHDDFQKHAGQRMQITVPREEWETMKNELRESVSWAMGLGGHRSKMV
jgi:hypothetical protein